MGRTMLVDYPQRFFKHVDFRIKTDAGLRPIVEMSKLVQSLKKAEEDRMMVLVLAEDDVRVSDGAKVKRLVSGLRK
jgi:hypothetical protein